MIKRLSVFLLLLLGTLLYAREGLENISLQLQWKHQFQFAGYYMAKEKGFYKEAGLDVEIREMNELRSVSDDVVQGKATYGTGRTSLIVERSQGKKLVMLAPIFQSSPIVLIAKKSSGIKSIEDFFGKRFTGGADIVNDISLIMMLNEQSLEQIGTLVSNGRSDIQNLLEDKVDAIVAYHSNESHTLRTLNANIVVFNPKDYGFDFYSDVLFTSEDEAVGRRQRTINFKKASLKGWEYAFDHIEETVDLILHKYNTQNKSRESLMNEASVLRELAFYKTDQIGTIDREKVFTIYDYCKQVGLIDKPVDFSAFIFNGDPNKKTPFTNEEQEYLAAKKEIVVCGHADWLPYCGRDEAGGFGILHDILKELESSVGLPFRFVDAESAAECAFMVLNGEADVISAMESSANTFEGITPSRNIFQDSVALVTKLDKPYIDNMSDHNALSIGVIGKYKNIIAYIKKEYPLLKVKEVASTEDGMKQVADGELDGYIDIYRVAAFAINNDYTGELKINTKINHLVLKGAMGISSNDITLRDILNKAIASLTSEKVTKIIGSWMRTRKVSETDYRPILQLMSVTLLIILGFLYRQRFLKRHNKLLLEANSRIVMQQEKIKEQKKIYELIFESAMDGILILDDGKFTDCNDAIVKMLKYKSKEDILNVSPAALSPEFQPDGRRSSEKADEMMTLAYEKRGHRFEWLHTKASGEDFWAEITLTPLRINDKEILHVLWREISEQKELELQNSYLKERMELAFDGSRDGLWDWNLIDNSVYFSPRWKEMLGYKDDELENSFEAWKSRVHPDDLEEAMEDIELNLDATKDIYENKHRLRHKDGHWVWIYDRGKVQFDVDGKPIRMIGTHTDLTTEINLANELSELNEHLEERIELALRNLHQKDQMLFQQSRLALMGEMLSMIAHQWRQPLAAISAAAGTLTLKNTLNRYEKEFFDTKLKNITGYAQHLSETINDFRNFFKEEKVMQVTTVEEIVKGALTIVEPTVESKGIALDYDYKCNSHHKIKTYSNEFKQVIINLLKNSEEALGEKEITDPRIMIKSYPGNHICTLEIRDNAGGIPESIIDKIFDPYFTTKKRDGTGLGLYMSKMIIEEHCKGKLSVRNEEEGALFTIEVPREIY